MSVDNEEGEKNATGTRRQLLAVAHHGLPRRQSAGKKLPRCLSGAPSEPCARLIVVGTHPEAPAMKAAWRPVLLNRVCMRLRCVSRRRMYLLGVGFQLSVVVLGARAFVVPEVSALRECIALRLEERAVFDYQSQARDATRELASRLEEVRAKLRAFGELSVDGGQVHSIARAYADHASLKLTSFVAMETEGEYLVNVEGAFNNAVVFAAILESHPSTLRVRRFNAHVVESSIDRIGLEILIKKSPHASVGPRSCSLQRE